MEGRIPEDFQMKNYGRTCQAHPKELETNFCVQCNKFSCGQCISNHMGHLIIYSANIINYQCLEPQIGYLLEMKKNLIRYQDRMDQMIKEKIQIIDKELGWAEQTKNNLAEQFGSLKINDQITQTFNELNSIPSLQKEIALKNLHFFKAKSKEYMNFSKNVEALNKECIIGKQEKFISSQEILLMETEKFSIPFFIPSSQILYLYNPVSNSSKKIELNSNSPDSSDAINVCGRIFLIGGISKITQKQNSYLNSCREVNFEAL